MITENLNTKILWEGESQLTGAPIVVIVTGILISGNKKTGNMLQTHILNQHISPVDAVKTGEDENICGMCTLRPFLNKKQKNEPLKNEDGICYILHWQSPQKVWNQYKKGVLEKIDDIDLSMFKRRGLRLGSYGDPSAVPFYVWKDILHATAFHTGYTSQWREDVAQDYKGICQASCHNRKDAQLAQSLGWKTYTNLPLDTENIGINSVKCPYSEDKTMQCIECKLCNGAKVNVEIFDHGAEYKKRKTTKTLIAV